MSQNIKALTRGKLMDLIPFATYQLPNGMDIVLVQNEISPVVSSLLHYKVGSAHEEDDQRGLAHFLEHMMFRGDPDADKNFDHKIAEMGGVGLNAFTSYDTTAYIVSVPTSQLNKLLKLEAARMVDLQLSDPEIDAERGAVLGEINMYQDMPSTQIGDRMMIEAFQQHTYRHPIIGYYQQVANFKRTDFERFYGQHYAPNNAFLIISGGFDETKTLELIWDAFAHLPACPHPVTNVRKTESTWQASNWLELEHPKVKTESLIMSWRSSGIKHPDYPTLITMAAWLGAGQASPLHTELVQGGLASHYCLLPQEQDMLFIDPALIVLELCLNPAVSSEQAAKKVQQLLEKLASEPPNQQNMARALNQLRLETYSVLGHNMQMARMIGGGLISQNDPLAGEKMLQQIEQVTATQVQVALQKWLLNAPKLCLCQRPQKSSTKPAAEASSAVQPSIQ